MTGRHWVIAAAFLLNAVPVVFGDWTWLRLLNMVCAAGCVYLFLITPRLRRARRIRTRKDYS